MPRHPPYALNNLDTNDQRCSHPLCNSQTPTRNTHHNQNHLDPHPKHSRDLVWSQRMPDLTKLDPENNHTRQCVVSGPNSVPTRTSSKPLFCCLPQLLKTGEQSLRDPSEVTGCPHRLPRMDRTVDSGNAVLLLRKEVIQPHLPVRLPCYDFVPIASPTFDHSLCKQLGHGLRVLPTFVT